MEFGVEEILSHFALPEITLDAKQNLIKCVEWHLRQIIEEGVKVQRRSKSSQLKVSHLKMVLKMYNSEPICGYLRSSDGLQKNEIDISSSKLKDKEIISLRDFMDSPFPKQPIETCALYHWLAVDGIQPAIPQNPPINNTEDSNKKKQLTQRINEKMKRLRSNDDSIEVKPELYHNLSNELQLYYDRVIETLSLRESAINNSQMQLVFTSLSTNTGLQELLPYLVQFLVKQVHQHLEDLPVLMIMLKTIKCILLNPYFHLEFYLQQLMPVILTCLVKKRFTQPNAKPSVGTQSFDNHDSKYEYEFEQQWQLRRNAAQLLCMICRRYRGIYINLQQRVTETLHKALTDESKALPCCYGAIIGLTALGPKVVELLILPVIDTLLDRIGNILNNQFKKNTSTAMLEQQQQFQQTQKPMNKKKWLRKLRDQSIQVQEAQMCLQAIISALNTISFSSSLASSSSLIPLNLLSSKQSQIPALFLKLQSIPVFSKTAFVLGE